MLGFTPISFLRKFNVVMKSLKVVAIGAQVYGNRAGKFEQGRMSSWIICESGPLKYIDFGVQNNPD